ncbi:transglycosylase domain-containing protein [Nocardioides marinquilinus]|uniref:Transglycosylase domain-containing protein n=1 Tax=Nocardioides marinquilinus TaxID=1210400 RepID=A0ABP9PDP7_9ACTN
MVAVSAVLGVVVAGLAIPFAGLVGFASNNIADSMDDLPKELDTEVPGEKSAIYDADGNLITYVYDENRINVSLDKVSRTLVKALVSIEDYRYYEHGALDVKGTMRALVTNLGSGGVVQGGSSITQQLVKQTLLNQANTKAERAAVTDDTYLRKFNELRYAIALEKKHSKDWILERYLNIVYFGDGAYGIQAAARHYYNVNASSLNLNQSATLAGLVQNPSAFDPTDHPDRAIARRDVVLDRMAELDVISEKRADAVKAKKLKLRPQTSPRGCLNSTAPLYCSYVLEYLLKDRSLGNNESERQRLLNTGGLTIRTNLNLEWQDDADRAVRGNVRATDDAIGALAIVEPGTGQVKAISQSRPYGDKRKKGETFLNFVVPSQYGDSNGFQAGSTFKAFVLAQAIEDGVPLDETYYSPNETTFNFSDYANCPGAPSFGTADFPMRNSTDGGYENLYTGTRDSVNTFYLRLEQETGVCDPYNLAKSMGVRLTSPEGVKDAEGNFIIQPERVPNFTLGVADVSALEMAEAYATFAARGIHCDSQPISSIEDANGNVLKQYEPRCSRVMAESTADAVSDVLRGVIEGGFASNERLVVDAAGKTGTTGTVAQSPSVWFVGYTPTVSAAAMIAGANDFGTPIGLDNVVINGVPATASGSQLAAPIWGDALKAFQDELPDTRFVYPSTVEGAGVETPYVPQAPPSTNGPGRGGNRGNDGRGGRR